MFFQKKNDAMTRGFFHKKCFTIAGAQKHTLKTKNLTSITKNDLTICTYLGANDFKWE